MPDLLLELFTEEIPARACRPARAREALRERSIVQAGRCGADQAHARLSPVPRRTAWPYGGVAGGAARAREERRGPQCRRARRRRLRVSRATGLHRSTNASERDTGKGEFYFAVRSRAPVDRPPSAGRDGARSMCGTALAEIDALGRWRRSLGACL